MSLIKSSKYLSIWKERQKEEKRRRQLPIKKAKAVAKILKEKYQAEDLILFGFLIWRPDYLWGGHVGLIPFEKAWPSMKKRALKEGLRLA